MPEGAWLNRTCLKGFSMLPSWFQTDVAFLNSAPAAKRGSAARFVATTIVALALTMLVSTFPASAFADASDEKKEDTTPKTISAKAPDEKASAVTTEKQSDNDKAWIKLFNGKDLEGWKVTEFGGQGDVFVENGDVVISQGVALSGIHTEQKLPKINYEVQYEAQRAAGSDFFAGLTFPVNDSFCSLILGGWGGGLCGLSSLDGMDASENQTTSYQQFDKGKWYKVRLVVTDEKIEAWLDGVQIVDVDTKDHRISVRFEVERSQPFGFSTWQTTGRIRNARLRPLPAAATP